MNFLSLRTISILSLLENLSARRPAALLFWSSFFVSLCFVLLINFIPARQPYIVIDAISEMLTYRVRRPEIAAMPLFEANLKGDFNNCPWPTMSQPSIAITGMLEPSIGCIVKYRFTPDLVAIDIDGGNKSAGSLTLSNGTYYDLPSRVVAVIGTGGVVRPLPIAGPAEIGREFGSVTTTGAHPRKSNDFMYGGSLKVFGYALLPPFEGALYSSGADYALPAGGRLTSDDDFDPVKTQSAAAPWFGIAELDKKGFKISATTVSSDLRMYRPGATGERETFALGLLTRIFYDPSLAIITVFLATFSFVMPPLKTLMGLKKRSTTNDKVSDNSIW